MDISTALIINTMIHHFKLIIEQRVCVLFFSYYFWKGSYTHHENNL